MSIFSAVGDFFRSPFEDDQEKKRRKLREQQEAQQRAAQKAAPKPQNRPAPNQTGLPMAKPSPQVPAAIASPAPLTAQTSLQPPQPPAPKQGFFNKLKDTFDANTEADKYRRTLANRPADFREANEAQGDRTYNNPLQAVAMGFVKPVAKATNTVASAVVGVKDQAENIGDLLKLRGMYRDGKIDKETFNRLSKEVGEKDNKARYGGKGGLFGTGAFYDDVRELEDKRKLAGVILETGGNLSQVIPQGAAFKQGLSSLTEKEVAKRLLQKEVFENVTGGLASTGGEQLKEGKFDPKALLTGVAIDAVTPVTLNKLGKLVGRMKEAGINDNAIKDVINKTDDSNIDDLAKATSEAEIKKIVGKKDKIAGEPVLKEKLSTDVQERAKIAVEDLRAETKAEMDRIDSSIATPEQKAVRKEAVMERLKKASDEIQANVAKSADEVDTAGAKAVAEQAARQDVVEEVQDAQKGAVEPGAKPVDGTEAAANDAYKTLDESLYKDAPGFEERGRSLGQTLSPDRVIRENITNPIENKLSELIGKAQVSDNSVARGVGRLFQGFSKEAGVSPELMQQKRLLRGGVEKGKMYRETIANLGNDVENASKTKVWSALDPEQAKKVGVEPADVSTFTPEELDYHNKLKEVIDITTKDLLDRGLITPAQAANGNYIKRAYSIFEDNSEVAKAYSESRQGFLNQFKKRKDVDKELLESAITDPSYLVAKKAAESQSAIAMVDYGDYLYNSGIAQDLPGAGRVQLPNSKLHGEAAGKWVPRGVAEDFTGFQYNIGMLNSFNDLVSAYDNLAIRKGKKGLLTVFNPAVRAGNQISNRVMFATMNGINPLQFNIAYQGVRGASKEASQLYREAVEQGLTGLDITQADFAKRIADGTGDVNLGKKALDWIKSSYSEADDRAKVAAYTVHRMRGYSPEDAARLTQRGFQDYNSVGFFYDLAAKTPLVGNAFVRFAADSMRIAKNTLVDHPLRTAGTIAAWATFVNGMSKLSGESAEDKATREGRFGAPKIPFTNISMAVQTPWGEVNAARFMPFYQLNDIGSPVSKFLPIAQNPFTPSGWQDPLLGQVGQAITDTDFRGKSIQDPENVKFADGTSKYQFDPLTDDQKKNNLLRFFFNQNVPLGREADTIKSAATGQEDIYGKDRSLMQALLRAGGLKVENYGAEQAKDTRATEEYFKRKEEIDKEVEGMTPQGQMAYRTLTGQYKLRDQKDNPFAPGETMDIKAPVYDFSENKYQEYMKNPELYDVMEKRAQTEAQANGAPLNPIFDPRLPREFRLQLIQQKSIAPGDNVELQERMYQSPNWDLYQDINDEYKAKAKAYYPQRDDENFDDEMLKHQNAPFPKKPQALKDSDAAYAAYLEGKAPKPEYTDAIKALKQQYNEQKWNWTNTERIARGLPLISWEEWDNKTFGFTPDNGKSGYGYGGGGGGGNNDWGKLGEISNTSIMDRLDAPEVAQLPALAKLLASAQGRRGGGRAKPKLGAASRGTG